MFEVMTMEPARHVVYAFGVSTALVLRAPRTPRPTSRR